MLEQIKLIVNDLGLSLDLDYAKMLFEAANLGVIEDVVTIIAILESGGIRNRKGDWRKYTDEKQSDLLAELDLWNVSKDKNVDQLREIGVFIKNYFLAQNIRKKIIHSLENEGFEISSTGNREYIKDSCISGMLRHVYYHKHGFNRLCFNIVDKQDNNRQLSKNSVITNLCAWIVGIPNDLNLKDSKGEFYQLKLVEMVTNVDVKFLMGVFPELVSKEEISFNSDKNVETGIKKVEIQTFFSGEYINSSKEERKMSPQEIIQVQEGRTYFVTFKAPTSPYRLELRYKNPDYKNVVVECSSLDWVLKYKKYIPEDIGDGCDQYSRLRREAAKSAAAKHYDFIHSDVKSSNAYYEYPGLVEDWIKAGCPLEYDPPEYE